MKKQHIMIVVSVTAKRKRDAKYKLINLMNWATVEYIDADLFPEWGFVDEYKLVGDKVKK